MKKKPSKEDLEKFFNSLPEDERPDFADFSDGEALWEKAMAESEEAGEPADELPEELEEDFETKYKQTQDRYQRTLAEFDNFRKRTAKEMASRYSDGVRAACERLLPIIDNFERAMGAVENKEDKFFQGIELIARQFEGVLSELGIEVIQTETGAAFDTSLHNAVAHVEDEGLGENVVADVLQKGYKHGDKVLRHVMVKVAN